MEAATFPAMAAGFYPPRLSKLLARLRPIAANELRPGHPPAAFGLNLLEVEPAVPRPHRQPLLRGDGDRPGIGPRRIQRLDGPCSPDLQGPSPEHRGRPGVGSESSNPARHVRRGLR